LNIVPFRGFRYGPAHGRDLTSLAAPPYDQITPEIQARLLEMSPHNIVRLTLPPGGEDRYQEARRVLDRWMAEGIFVRESQPAIYPYHQVYRLGDRAVTRRAFIALGEVSDYAQGQVLPHERTHAGPKKDRMQLLEATGADIGLLFMLVSDPAGALMREVGVGGDPIAEARDLRGDEHRLWRITDGAVIERVKRYMAARSVIIADGHHRYETAVEYAKAHPHARYKLMAFTALEGTGVTILPTHRLVKNVEGFSIDKLARVARNWFDVTPLRDPLAFRPKHHTLGVVAGEQAMTFRFRDDSARNITWPPRTSRTWRELDVAILHEAVLKPLLGIGDDKLEAGTHVDYVADQAEAVRLAQAGQAQAAFLIAATTVQEMQAVVQGGEVLPQKSTFFYPKLLDGLVFHQLEG
jgi:uncharacterized protein (DUF1015 family)